MRHNQPLSAKHQSRVKDVGLYLEASLVFMFQLYSLLAILF